MHIHPTRIIGITAFGIAMFTTAIVASHWDWTNTVPYLTKNPTIITYFLTALVIAAVALSIDEHDSEK